MRSARSEDSATSATSDGRDGWDAADCDEDGTEGRHHFRVIRGEKVECAAGVEKPGWDIGNIGDS